MVAFDPPGAFRLAVTSVSVGREGDVRNAARVKRRVAAITTSLLRWFETHGRKELPWRVVRDPYYTIVSEFMLQQTQVERAGRSFQRFVSQFPDLRALASASTADVLRAWQGLGYNSRAVRLKSLAATVVERYDGAMPSETAQLRALPGIGPYTAAAVRAFAFDLDDAPVDTNVRRIVSRLFYGIDPNKQPPGAELEERARALVPPGRAHDWSSALMDLGSAICTARAPQCAVCPLERWCAAAPVDAAELKRYAERQRTTRASGNRRPFAQSNRYARGRVVERLRALPPDAQISLLDLHRSLEPLLGGRTQRELLEVVAGLERDGLVQRRGERLALPR